ncbi:F-box/kelch-repeat protein [Raphanus sativus]|uniref:F-box/kelch-repeat protein At4g39550 n=1 Tax=Raphanus sativus TaxID=3726 RepID=A0A6J0MFX9_RAPSA|nr:F-box/kelch-repeat protein At4g39550 [Raphanus sativus]KAJ4914053.1 F-box/kelch-repeat protein [Raphanus sativus]
MSAPVKKRKTTKRRSNTKTQPLVLPQTPESTPNPSLPDDLIVSCLARVSRLQYPTLSLVSKTFRSLLASPHLYETRSSLGHTESCLYVCINFHPDDNPSWYTLCRKPDRTLTTNDTMNLKKKKQSEYALAKLPTPPSRRSAHWSGLVTVGSDLYNIGGPIDDADANEPSSSVSILDCRSNTWREGPSMLVKRNFPHANVVDGKIYVTGDSNSGSSKWMEVFDTKTQTWELVSTPAAEMRLQYDIISTSAGIDGKVYIFGSCNGLAYDTREGRWESVGMEMSSEWVWFSYCVVENVIYVYDNEEFKWYDTKARLWRVLKGLKGLPKFPRYTARLADYGGKMAVFWGRVVASTGYVDKMIWCAVIVLERRSDQEIWGKVEWKEPVLKVPKSCRINHALAATL